MIGHVHHETLVALALGEMPVDGGTTGAHLADCAACRADLQALRAMRATLLAQQETVPEKMLARIEAGRAAAGVAADTPDPIPALPARNRPSFLVRTGRAAAVAAALAAVSLIARSERSAPARAPIDRTADPGAAASASAGRPALPQSNAEQRPEFAMWPVVAYAASAGEQESVYAPIGEVMPERIVPGRREYVRSSASAYRGITPKDVFMIAVDSARLRGLPVWRIVTEQAFANPRFARTDTAWIRRSDLRLLQQRQGFGGFMSRLYRVDGDSLLFHSMRLNGGFGPGLRPELMERIRRAERVGQPIDRERRIVLTLPSFLVLLRALPLHATWRGSIAVHHQVADSLSPTRARPPGAPPRSNMALNVSVQGDTLMSTLRGHVWCWRVVLHTGANPERWYVSKRTGEVVAMTGPEAMNWPRSRLDLLTPYSEDGLPK